MKLIPGLYYLFSFKRRHSSFRRFASSLRMRRSHVIKNVKRQTVEGCFNAAYVADGNEQQQLKPNQTVRVQAKNDYGNREQETYGISKVSRGQS